MPTPVLYDKSSFQMLFQAKPDCNFIKKNLDVFVFLTMKKSNHKPIIAFSLGIAPKTRDIVVYMHLLDVSCHDMLGLMSFVYIYALQ